MRAGNTARQVPGHGIRGGHVFQRCLKFHLIPWTLGSNIHQINVHRRTSGGAHRHRDSELTAETHQSFRRCNMVHYGLFGTACILQHTVDVNLVVSRGGTCHTRRHGRHIPSITHALGHISVNPILRNHMEIGTCTYGAVCHVIDMDSLGGLRQYDAFNRMGTAIVIRNLYVIYQWKKACDGIRTGT